MGISNWEALHFKAWMKYLKVKRDITNDTLKKLYKLQNKRGGK